MRQSPTPPTITAHWRRRPRHRHRHRHRPRLFEDHSIRQIIHCPDHFLGICLDSSEHFWSLERSEAIWSSPTLFQRYLRCSLLKCLQRRSWVCNPWKIFQKPKKSFSQTASSIKNIPKDLGLSNLNEMCRFLHGIKILSNK